MKTQFNFIRNAVITALLLTFAFGHQLIAQEAPPTLYFEITKLKKKSDDMEAMIEELVKPYVQERIKQGNQRAFALFEVLYPQSDNAEYDYVAVDVYSDFNHLHLEDRKKGEMAYAAFPNFDYNKVKERFEAAATQISSEVFRLRDEAFPGPKGGDGKMPAFVQVNHMKVSEANRDAYVDMESEIFKPIHQARAKAGNMHEWMLMERIMPYGSEWDNNFITFDIFSEWGHLAGGGMNGLFAKVHPGKDANAQWNKIAEIREIRRTETWELVSMVNEAAPEVTYEIVKEGAGTHPMKGQEVAFKGTLMNLDGQKLMSTTDLGYDFHYVMGENIYDRFFEKGLKQMKKGSVMKMTVPADYQDEQMKNMTGGKTAVMNLEVLDIGIPKPDGAKLLGETLEKQGLDAAKEEFQKLKAEGAVFRENSMNVLGYRLLEKGHTQAAVYVFQLNQENYPGSWNACDSLGDGYRAAGDYAKAKHCYEMALKINPDFEASKNKLGQM